MIYIAPIVEGHGEVEAFPALLHRIVAAEGFQGQLIVNAPIRVKAGSFLHDDSYRKKQLILAASKAADRNGAVIVLLDCDDACPAELGPKLDGQVKAIRDDVHILIALAYREYESWFLAAAHSLRGRRGLPQDLNSPPDADSIRGAKGWLSRHMEAPYDPITHQVEFSRAIDLVEARMNPSFDRLCRRVRKLIESQKKT